MDKKTFENTLVQNWMNHFGCSAEIAQQAGTTLLPTVKYQGDKIIVIWHIGNHAFVQFDPSFQPQLEKLVGELPADISITGSSIQKAWGDETILSQDVGLAYYLFPPDLPEFTPPPPFILRQLTEADAEAMSALHDANTPEDVDEGFVEVTHQVAFGCFLNGKMVSAASGYKRNGFLDIGVLTHPEFRKKRLGKAVVGALCNWANQQKIIAQYRHDILNVNSQKVAKSLNFQMYFKSEALSLR